MNWKDIKSSCVCSIAFELDQGLFVLFQDGTQYLYEKASYKLFKDWLQAESKGKFFNMNVRNKYKAIEID